MLPKEAIAEYKQLYKKKFGIKLSDTEASFRANNLINLYKAVFGHDEKQGSIIIKGEEIYRTPP